MDLPKDTTLLVITPRYGIPEAGLHWYLTYLSHHIDAMGMTRSKADPFLLIKRTDGHLHGAIALQVDDRHGFGDEYFLREEKMHPPTS